MGLKRRLSMAEYEAREREFKAIVKAELDRGEITSYGRSMLHTYFHSTPSMQMLISRYTELAEKTPKVGYLLIYRFQEPSVYPRQGARSYRSVQTEERSTTTSWGVYHTRARLLLVNGWLLQV